MRGCFRVEKMNVTDRLCGTLKGVPLFAALKM